MESSRRLIILLVAGVIVAFAAIAIRNRMSSEPAADAPVITRVLVAKRDVPPGSFVQAGVDVDWEQVPDDYPSKELLINEAAFRLQDFNGAVVRKQLRAGEPIQQTALMKAGEGGFMSAVLEPGMRAVSIAVTATSGNAGFISPGDRVDLIVTHRIKIGANKDTGAGEEAVVSETFVSDVRVVAVDQMLDNPENKAILAKTVTVEVTQRQAQQIAVASEMGKISVALRSLTNGPVAQPSAAAPAAEPAAGEPAAATDPASEPLAAPADPAAVPAETQSPITDEKDVSPILSGMSPRVKVIRGDQMEILQFY